MRVHLLPNPRRVFAAASSSIAKGSLSVGPEDLPKPPKAIESFAPSLEVGLCNVALQLLGVSAVTRLPNLPHKRRPPCTREGTDTTHKRPNT